jgi:hypothetical protein
LFRRSVVVLLGGILFFWLVAGFLWWYDRYVDDVSVVRVLTWVFWGGVAVMIIILISELRKPSSRQ